MCFIIQQISPSSPAQRLTRVESPLKTPQTAHFEELMMGQSAESSPKPGSICLERTDSEFSLFNRCEQLFYIDHPTPMRSTDLAHCHSQYSSLPYA